MCTVVVSIGSSEAWPLLLAANRDERLDRPWAPPAAHWPDLPGVVGGRDRLAGGTWLALSQAGVVAAVLNRTGSLGPQTGKRSRGELPLMALAHGSAAEAAAALGRLDATDWRSFNLVVGDRHGAWFLRGLGHGAVTAALFSPGVHMVTAHDPDDAGSARVRRNLPRFRSAPAPSPPDWGAWPALLTNGEPPLEAAMCLPDTGGFGTASHAVIGVGRDGAQFGFATPQQMAGGLGGMPSFPPVFLPRLPPRA